MDTLLDISKTDFELTHRSINQIILGEYKFQNLVNIYHPEQTKNDFPILTELHESQHLHTCSSTPFGLFQKILGLLMDDPGLPKSLQKEFNTVLSYSIQHSWNAHEGIATAMEIVAAISSGGPKFYKKIYDSLPADYRKAVEPFKNALFIAELPICIGYAFSQGLSHIVFSTPIFRDMENAQKVLTTNWGNYYSNLEASPDARLEALSELVLTREKLLKVSGELWAFTRNFLDATTASPLELLEKYLSLANDVKSDFEENAVLQTIKLFQDFLPFKLEKLEVSHAFNSSIVFLNHMLKFLEDNGVKLQRNYITADMSKTYDERYEHALNISYVANEEPITCANIPFNDLTWSKIINSDSSLYIYFIYNYTHTKLEMDDKNIMEVEPSGGYVRIQSIQKTKNEYVFESPVHSNSENDFACAINLPAENIISILADMWDSNHIVVMSQPVWNYLVKGLYEKAIPKTKYAIFISLWKSTLISWEAIIKEIIVNNDVQIMKVPMKSSETSFLLAKPKEINTIFFSPTSEFVIERVKSKYKEYSSISLVEYDTDQTNLKWSERLIIALYHYSKYGW